MKSKSGFTLVEVVVVIGIVAILTVIIFPSIYQIRAKNRDTERVSDIAAIQLGLSLYYNQNPDQGYPANLDVLIPKYMPADSKIPPNTDPDYEYVYVPLARNPGNKCTYYHLVTKLELPSSQIDTADNFNSLNLDAGTTYNYCGDNTKGFDGTQPQMYNVHP